MITGSQQADQGTIIKQGYLSSDIDRNVRVRLYGEKGKLTIKGRTKNLSRAEFEYDIPLEEAKALIEMCERPIIAKTRYLVKAQGNTWEIDVFEGENEGLIVAEIELANENQAITLPDWIGEEVSQDTRYYNVALIKHPFKHW